MARNELRTNMRDILIEHMDGKQVVIRQGGGAYWTTLYGLINRGLVRFDRTPHPRYTIITDAGRTELAKALADWADALSRAGCGVGENIDALVERLLEAS